MIKKKDFKVNHTKQARIVKHAMREFSKHSAKCAKLDKIVVIDMTAPSYKKRLWLVRVKDNKVLRQHHVAHGVNSSCKHNRALACRFGNKYGSRMSSKGAMVTAETYWGKWGKSLKLDGLEPGVNDNVRKRAVVMHKSTYVTDPYILRTGRAGQSWGCPAVDPAIWPSLREEIKGGTFVYIYHE